MRQTLIALIHTILIGISVPCIAYNYPANIQRALKLAGKNATEFEKVLKHYENKNTQKFQAACFLIEHMPIHCGQSYYWEDTSFNKITFNEFDYPTYEKAVEEFNSLSQKQKLHPIKTFSKDLQTITAEYLIKNIDDAFSVWKDKWSNRLPFNLFCEYLLPYRVMDEPISQWREEYRTEFASQWSKCKNKTIRQACTSVCEDLKLWFSNIYDHEVQKEPQHVLSAKQILFRRQGYCEDMANWGVYMLRSQGIASCVDFTPFWATSTDGHFWQCAFDEIGKTIPFFMGDDTPAEFIMRREPSKVFRITYSSQDETPANFMTEDEIPEGVLRSSNLIDVTGEYWRVGNIRLTLPLIYNNYRAAYLCVLNGGKWRPVWWSENHNGLVEFRNMSCGVVYLPVCYKDNQNIPVAPPQLLRIDGRIEELIPDMTHTRSIRIEEQKGYLQFRAGKRYTLYYWSLSEGKWKAVKTLIPKRNNYGNFEPLIFDNVPANALMRLVPEYSQHKERPFTINEQGLREWW